MQDNEVEISQVTDITKKDENNNPLLLFPYQKGMAIIHSHVLVETHSDCLLVLVV